MRPAEVLIHPVRFRIVQAFLGDRELTTADLREELADVPAATLYRQVATLQEADVLTVVSERKVRGTVERTYRLTGARVSVDGAEALAMTRDDHARLFLTFLAGLAGEFDRYLGREEVDLARDLVGYRQLALHLTDEETVGMLTEMSEVVARYVDHAPGPDRTRRILSTVLMPG